jgi:hypothetical protein
MSIAKDLDLPILRLFPDDSWSLRDLCEGVCISGQIGAGKTSGTRPRGGLVTVVKPKDAEAWKRLAKESGREQSLLPFDENE